MELQHADLSSNGVQTGFKRGSNGVRTERASEFEKGRGRCGGRGAARASWHLAAVVPSRCRRPIDPLHPILSLQTFDYRIAVHHRLHKSYRWAKQPLPESHSAGLRKPPVCGPADPGRCWPPAAARCAEPSAMLRSRQRCRSWSSAWRSLEWRGGMRNPLVGRCTPSAASAWAVEVCTHSGPHCTRGPIACAI
jgi:hypothetical protein